MRRALQQLRTFTVGLYSAMVLRLQAATWRVESDGLQQLDERIARGEKLIAVFWHGKYYALLPLLRHRRACVFTSVSSRGDVIANILQRFGFNGIQLPDHGGEHSLDIMRSALRESPTAAIAVDGPLGPYHVVHRGAVQLASELGHQIVPIAIAIGSKRVLENRWDKFEMPRVFSRTVLVIADPISVPPHLNQAAVDQWIARVKQALDAADVRAESRLRRAGVNDQSTL